jgi:hypothetical protein
MMRPQAAATVAPQPLLRRLSRSWQRVARASVSRGLPASWLGYRWLPAESVQAYFARRAGTDPRERYETVHAEAVARNPLPRNVASRDELPGERGWWGYSFRDVPARVSGETFIATLTDCLVVCYRDPSRANDFYPAILTGDGRAIELREIRFRPLHAATLRRAAKPVRMSHATWVAERVYHNHSHWLTAHLPKLLLLRDRGALADVLLPSERTAAIDGSLRLLGLPPEEFPAFDVSRPLRVDRLTIVGTDRFRPELLTLVPRALGIEANPSARRRVFISRAGAARRRLVNEDEIWPMLERAGFERALMETLSVEAQVALMRETAVLVAPHGAGLTNMMFCPPGAHVVECADPGFPNPNFYALASAMAHHYWLVPATALGDVHPLEQDLRVDADSLRQVLRALPS